MDFQKLLATRGKQALEAMYDNSVLLKIAAANPLLTQVSAKNYVYEMEIINKAKDKTFTAGEWDGANADYYKAMALTKPIAVPRTQSIIVPIESEQLSFDTGKRRLEAKLTQFNSEAEHEVISKYFADEVMFGTTTYDNTKAFVPAQGNGEDQLPAGEGSTGATNFGYNKLTYTPTATEAGEQVRDAIQAAVTKLKTSRNATTNFITLNEIMGWVSSENADLLRKYLEDRAGAMTPEIFKNDWRFIGMVAGIPIMEAPELNGRGNGKEIVVMRKNAIQAVYANALSKVDNSKIDPQLMLQYTKDAHLVIPWGVLAVEIDTVTP